ncbi:MAG: S8 family serine peptidase [Oscillospiraceae bacterium]
MKSKHLLSMLLVICMVFSILSPAVNATTAGADSVATGQTAQSAETSATPAEEIESVTPKTLKTDPLEPANSKAEGGAWIAAPLEKNSSPSLQQTAAPACVEELRKAAEELEPSEWVTAFVVMEDAALADTHTSICQVSSLTEKQMLQKQDAVIASIEDHVLGGEELEVRYQFTYLTNAFSIKTEFRNLEEIAALDGVKSVFLAPVYQPVETGAGDVTPLATSSGQMVGVPSVWAEELGYTGTGMKIAVIDTGLDMDHKSFAAAPEVNDSSMTAGDIAAVLGDLNAYSRMNGKVTADDLYYSAKMPFAFNYSDSNLVTDHARDNQGDHGTHVAGIAAANANVEGTDVVGMAPDAQIIVMKVFGATRAGVSDDIVAALEDAMTLGCDVANLSLGSTAGFTSSDTELDLIYERIASQDIIVAIAAGNDGTSSANNLWGTNKNPTAHPDNAVIGSPAIYPNATAVASANNANGMSPYFTYGETKVAYTESRGLKVTFDSLARLGELEYVMIPGVGEAQDFQGLDLAGKVAVAQRGSIPFSKKLANAEAAGAVGLIVYDNSDAAELIAMDMTDGTTGALAEGVSGDVPAVSICKADGEAMAAAGAKKLTVSAEQGIVPSAIGGQISSFSSWGVAPNLTLAPDITAIGGNVYSTVDRGQYDVKNGTSMATPQIAGISALVMEYLYEKYPDAPDGSLRKMAEALLMSTAEPVDGSASDVEASPRQQGSGLVNALSAVTSEAYLTVGGNKPKVSLGDNATGEYTFSFEVHNFSGAEKRYTLSASLLTEDVTNIGGIDFMAEQDRALSGSVTFDKDTVVVPAGGIANVTVTVQLSEEDKVWMDEHFENGIYVEGFVYLTNEAEDGVDLSLPYLGFYGDWTDAPVFDSGFWYDNGFFGLQSANGLPDANEYYNVVWTSLGQNDWVLGLNPYVDPTLGEDGKIIYDPAHNSVSPNGDGILDDINEIYLSLMRNAKTLTFTYTIDGEVVQSETFGNASKTAYRSAVGQTIPWIYSWYGKNLFDFSGLPSGTEVLLTIRGAVDYGNGGDHVLEIPITVDTKAPELLGNPKETQKDGKYYLSLEVTDEVDLAVARLMNTTGTRILREASSFETNEEGNRVVTFDITGLGTEFQLSLGDFAANESAYKLTYVSAEDGNMPELDQDLLYAYRIHDQGIVKDDMYGWVQFAKTPDADNVTWVHTLTNDRLETYALTAAEYAGGKIFAVDAGNNFLVMEPGLWDRTVITNLGVPVVDMAFDDTTDTMYLVTRKGGAAMIELQSVDLLTGELTMVKNYGHQLMGPYNIAISDDGVMYANRRTSANLFVVDRETWTMKAVTGEDGKAITFQDHTGAKLSPNYAQSMTFADGKIYWTYFNGKASGNTSELLTIDPANGYAYTHTAFGNVSAAGQSYQSDNELVGLLTLEETEYQIPSSSEVTSIWLDTTQLLMKVGETAEVKVNPIPWNVELTNVTWSSSNEAVATVDNGVVTATGTGDAVITARCGDLTATCQVVTIKISGGFYAYDYYNGADNYGDMIRVDLENMTYESLADVPVEFIAGDYNGHDGCFYGYDEGGQLYRYNVETGECTAAGAAQGNYPSDMAYDYTTGNMYAVNNGSLYSVNLKTGEMVSVAYGSGSLTLWTLACDGKGQLYSIATSGELVKLQVNGRRLEYELVMENLGYLSYVQSMCYDYANDVLVWATPEYATVAWIGHNAETPYIIPMGEPTGTGVFEFVGMYTIPERIPELAPVAVEGVSLYTTDRLMLTGSEYTPNLSIQPANANDYTMTWASADANVVTVNAGGLVKAVNPGKTTVTCTVTDNVSKNTWSVSVEIEVIEGVEELYGFVANNSSWVKIPTGNPKELELLASTIDMVYTQEYCNGKVYAYGFDPTEWNDSTWNFYIMDPKTFEAEEVLDMPAGFPFVYDMTYDYTTSTAFAVAGPTDSESDLYMVDLETGLLTRIMETEQMLIALTAGPDGKLYAAENNSTKLYVIDPAEGTCELLNDSSGHTYGVSSMTYDYENGKIFHTSFGNLSLIDPETGKATHLGTIGPGGAISLTVTGLFNISDSFPKEPETYTLKNLFLNAEKTILTEGATQALTAVALPMPLTDSVVWSSSNEKVATVDQNGVVTARSMGTATITASVTDGITTMERTCIVSVLSGDASFLTYNVTDRGWAHISRGDVTKVTNLTEGVEESIPTAIASIDDVVYGFDEENNFFSLDTETFKRTIIADAGTVMTHVTLLPDQGVTEFVVRDLAYDKANDRLVALGTRYGINDYGQVQEFTKGSAIYSVDLETGVLKPLYTFDQHNFVNALTVGDDGIIYFYETEGQYYYALDPVAGTITSIISGISQSAYGDDDGRHDLYYDSFNGLIYHLFTSNSTFYCMYTVNPATSELALVDYVGEMTQQGAYRYTDNYSGLTFVYAHAHDYQLTDSKAATCESDGYEVWTCAECDETYTESIPALGHDLTSKVVEPTCTAEGYTQHDCGRCGLSYRDTIVPALGHKTELRDAREATCTADGYTGDEVCTVCEEIVKQGEVIPATGHSWDEGVVKTEPGCCEEGVMHYTCTVCGETKEENISPKGHQYEKTVIDPTCTASGYDEYVCTVCGYEYHDHFTAPLGHGATEVKNAKGATCTEDGYTGDEVCTVCGEIVKQGETIPALGHKTEIQNAKEATCTEDGYTGDEVCTVCGEIVKEGQVIPAHCPSKAFADLNTDRWYHEYTDYVIARELMNGMDETHFAPEGNLTRGQLVTTLYRLAGEPEVVEPATFTDVKAGRYYTEAVAWGEDLGIVKGMTDDTFSPEGTVTREQAATFLYRYVTNYLKQEPGQGADLQAFADGGKVQDYAKTAMSWAVAEGFFEGYGDGTLRPGAVLTRAQMAKLLTILDRDF